MQSIFQKSGKVVKKKTGKHALKIPFNRYPSPGPVGGRILRQMVGQFKLAKQLTAQSKTERKSIGSTAMARKFGKTKKVEDAPSNRLPLDQEGRLSGKVYVAVSGGVDSVCLLHALVKYGRRIVANPIQQIEVVHFNHGWRGLESDADETFVKSLAKSWKLKVHIFRLKPSLRQKAVPVFSSKMVQAFDPKMASEFGESLENQARIFRKQGFEKLLSKTNDSIAMTGHQRDDLVETLIWRFFTGQFNSHSGGILPFVDQELRLMLQIPKADLLTFAKEEGIEFRQDQSNESKRFQRNRIRHDLVPMIESFFPKYADHLSRYAHEGWKRHYDGPPTLLGSKGKDQLTIDLTKDVEKIIGSLLTQTGLRLNRTHISNILRLVLVAKLRQKSGKKQAIKSKSLTLPSGWRLIKT